MTKLYRKLFPVQSREQELNEAVEDCLRHIMSNNDFNVTEQAYVVKRLNVSFRDRLTEKETLLNKAMEELGNAKTSLGLVIHR